jgi:beta-phosphoglucomutase family hydrolase/Cof subfamily protein (haloacid dehalogenase superfamily)
LLVADVDGTLLTPDQALTVRATPAVERLRSAGIQLGLTSSRPPRGLAGLAGSLGLTTPVAAFDGAMLLTPDLSRVLEQRTVPLAVAVEVVDHLESSGLQVWVYRGSEWFVTRADGQEVENQQRTVGFAPTVVPDLRSILEGAVKIVGLGDDAGQVARGEVELRQRVGAHARVVRSQPQRLDVGDPEANQGLVVRLLSRFLKIPLDEIAVIGDMPDDVLMFAVAGTSIAMGNAGPEVQRAARYVTSSNQEEGFASAVDRFVLRQPRRSPQAALGLPSATRACLFDLDGVLTQTAKLHSVAWKEIFDQYLAGWARTTGQAFVPFDPAADYARYVDGKLRLDGARSFLGSRGIVLPEHELEELARRKDEHLIGLLEQQHVETYDGSVRFVRAVRQAGLRTAVVSSSRNCEQVLASAGIADLFDARIDGVVAAAEHLAGKPAPDTFLAGAHALGVEPVESAVFEDALSGVEAGRAGHFGYVVGVDRQDQAAELRRRGADIVVADLAALLE